MKSPSILGDSAACQKIDHLGSFIGGDLHQAPPLLFIGTVSRPNGWLGKILEHKTEKPAIDLGRRLITPR
jgi:hypothetical protein